MPATVIGSELVAKNIKAYANGFTRHVNSVMGGVKQMLDGEVTKNMSLTCHDLGDLRRLGHPYGHGPREYKPLHDPNWQVHKQTGELLASKKSGVIEADIRGGTLMAGAWVGLDTEYVDYLIWGTSKMIPRDFMMESLNNIKESAVEYLKRNLRDLKFDFKAVRVE